MVREGVKGDPRRGCGSEVARPDGGGVGAGCERGRVCPANLAHGRAFVGPVAGGSSVQDAAGRTAALPPGCWVWHRGCQSSGVVSVRSNGDGGGSGLGPASPGACAEPGASDRRLNLLLSCAGWRPETWVDQIPPLLGPMGVVAHRASSGAEASRVIRTVPIHIAVVDLGLPWTRPRGSGGLDGWRPAALDMLRRLEASPPTVIVKRMRTHRDEARDPGGLRAGAFAVVDRPSTPADLEIMLDVLRRCLCRFYKERWPGSSLISDPPRGVWAPGRCCLWRWAALRAAAGAPAGQG